MYDGSANSMAPVASVAMGGSTTCNTCRMPGVFTTVDSTRCRFSLPGPMSTARIIWSRLASGAESEARPTLGISAASFKIAPERSWTSTATGARCEDKCCSDSPASGVCVTITSICAGSNTIRVRSIAGCARARAHPRRARPAAEVMQDPSGCHALRRCTAPGANPAACGAAASSETTSSSPAAGAKVAARIIGCVRVVAIEIPRSLSAEHVPMLATPIQRAPTLSHGRRKAYDTLFSRTSFLVSHKNKT